MLTISSAEFQRYLGHYQDVAAVEPLAITSYGRARFVLLPAANYDWLAGIASAVTTDMQASRAIGNFLAALPVNDRGETEPPADADQAHDQELLQAEHGRPAVTDHPDVPEDTDVTGHTDVPEDRR